MSHKGHGPPFADHFGLSAIPSGAGHDLAIRGLVENPV